MYKKKVYIIFIALVISIIAGIICIERYFTHKDAKKFEWDSVDIDSKISNQIPLFRKIKPNSKTEGFVVKFDKRKIYCPRIDTIDWGIMPDTGIYFLFSDSSYLEIYKGTGYDTYRKITDQSPSNKYNVLIPFLEKNNIKSNSYTLWKLIHSFEPDQIGYFDSEVDLKYKYALISMKNIILCSGGEDYLCEFESDNGIRGFQYGLADENREIYIVAFPEENQPFFIITEGCSQKQLDQLINSLGR